jgi:16S rRNA C1402 N4-methylase RsmH
VVHSRFGGELEERIVHQMFQSQRGSTNQPRRAVPANEQRLYELERKALMSKKRSSPKYSIQMNPRKNK